MKVLFNIAHLANRGGKERVLVNKANYMAEIWGIEVFVVTTEQKDRPLIYPLSNKVRHIDLNVCYEDYRKKGVIANRLSQAHCIRKHRQALAALLLKERPDITVSMFGREIAWLPQIKDGSRKILEYHFYKDVLKRDARKQPLLWLKYWTKMRAIKYYDRFVVLTEEDRELWGSKKNMIVVPNALTFYPNETTSLQNKRILAVGRLCMEKGFDRLLALWKEIAPRFPEWKLSIVGDGDKRTELQTLVEDWGLGTSVDLLPATGNIMGEYLSSSIYVLTSRNEGFPMVLLEAMACGLPVVAYACKCGPREIIHDGEDGFLVNDGDVESFISKLSLLMEDSRLRERMGQQARENIVCYSMDKVMEKWRTIYDQLLSFEK